MAPYKAKATTVPFQPSAGGVGPVYPSESSPNLFPGGTRAGFPGGIKVSVSRTVPQSHPWEANQYTKKQRQQASLSLGSELCSVALGSQGSVSPAPRCQWEVTAESRGFPPHLGDRWGRGQLGSVSYILGSL